MAIRDPHGVADLHDQWSALNARLRAHERLLDAALAQYAEGFGSLPSELLDEVTAMRAECSAKFKAMLEAIRLAGDARQNNSAP